MKTIIKRTIGTILLLIIIPVIFGLLTLDGRFCSYGDCNNVVVFWGGFIIGLTIVGFALAIFLIGILIAWLFNIN